MNTPCTRYTCETIPGNMTHPPTYNCAPEPTITCQANDACFNYTCVPNNGLPSCQPVPIVDCNDNMNCTTDSCHPVMGCQNVRDVVCNDNDRCTKDECIDARGGCVHDPVDDCSCDPNPCFATTTNCTDSDRCTMDTCISNPTLWPVGSNQGNTLTCAELPPPHDALCATALNVSCSATYCYSGERRTCPSTNCTQLACDANTGECAFVSSTVCDDNDACTQDTCEDDVLGGCVYTNRTCAQFSLCELRECIQDAARDNWWCNVTQTLNCDDGNACTIDSCDPSRGCIHERKRCEVSTDCHINLGCNRTTGECSESLVTTLLDFCGTCKGDNIACFFQSVDNFSVAAGVGAGVTAAIVLSAVCALLIGLFASKKGYDFYKASSAGRAAGAQDNPMFQDNANTRDAGDVFDGL